MRTLKNHFESAMRESKALPGFMIADSTIADATYDRLAHNTYRLNLKGVGNHHGRRRWYEKKTIWFN